MAPARRVRPPPRRPRRARSSRAGAASRRLATALHATGGALLLVATAGGAVPFPGGAVELGREVPMWVELVAVRDPWLLVGGVGAALLAAGLLAGAIAAFRGRRAGGTGAPSGPAPGTGGA